MKPRSMRARLAGWYLVLLFVATVAVAAGSWALLDRSVLASADATLRARVSAVHAFAESAIALPHEEFVDEFREYAQLTPGDSLLEVTDDAGAVLCEPAMTGWRSAMQSVSRPGPSAGPILETLTISSQPYRVVLAAFAVRDRTFHMIAATPIGTPLGVVSSFGWTLVALVPIVMGAAALGGYLISRRALAPVDRLTSSVEAITLQRLDRRIDVPTGDVELQRIAVAFNRMLARIEDAVAEMTRLSAEASHELRTPVALVRTTAELALSRDRSADDYRQALREVLDISERMSTLVGDLLVLARDEADIEEPAAEPVEVARVVSDAARSVQAAMTRRGLELDIQTSARPMVAGSASAIGRLVLILVDNAIKYSPPGGRVSVHVDETPNGTQPARARIAVTDQGIGIAPAERDRVFERFYRGTAARAGGEPGTGLGLAIARAIAERHGGTIDVGDGPGGRGASVVVTLPMDVVGQNLN